MSCTGTSPSRFPLRSVQIVWELVSDIEESQEIAMRAREKVLSKLQETLELKTMEINNLAKV